MILLWLDIDLINFQVVDYEEKDVILNVVGFWQLGVIWVVKLDYCNWQVSLLYGILLFLCDVMIFVGIEELMYLDVMDFVEWFCQ